MKIDVNYTQIFQSVETVIKDVMEAQTNDGNVNINEGIQIALKALDEIAKVFTDSENKVKTICDSLKGMFGQLEKAISDGHMSKMEIILLSMKIVQLITDIIKIVN